MDTTKRDGKARHKNTSYNKKHDNTTLSSLTALKCRRVDEEDKFYPHGMTKRNNVHS
jgi:hypothetical protein